jgi:hypothetical protein
MVRALAAILLFLFLVPVSASAQQILETVGTRALGMGGAFVGVADDPTAVFWNPAGLATGPAAGMTIGWVDFRTGNQSAIPSAGPTRRTSKFVSLGSIPVGFSYQNSEESAIEAPLGQPAHLQTFKLSSFGTTVVQTLVQGLVVGTTVKYLRGTAISGPVTGLTAHDALDAAGSLEASATNQFDLDIGLMADFGRARAGVTMRNLRQPSFTDNAGSAITLRRQTRLGVAVLPAHGLTLAMDVDLDTVALRDGPRRILAFGAEKRFGHWAVRGGTRSSLDGSRQRVGSLGTSVALHRSLWLDALYTAGHIDADRGFSIALRAGA